MSQELIYSLRVVFLLTFIPHGPTIKCIGPRIFNSRPNQNIQPTSHLLLSIHDNDFSEL